MECSLPLEDSKGEAQSEVTRSHKSVSFHPSDAIHESPTGYLKNHSYVTESVWESRESNSGYRNDVQNSINEGIRRGFYRRLYRFYEHYNPQKLNRVEEYLLAYKGEEEQLFAILTGKYGPEPQDTPSMSACSSENESVMHFVGKRYAYPTVVSPQQGNTDCETPYWANNSILISERDILSLLCDLETENEALQKCYMGLFSQHPSSSWNGMTYITRTEHVFPHDTTLLGHIWAGELANRKVMIHKGTAYYRVILYCTDECQRQGDHERWRLSVYSSEVNSLRLLRTVWDPVVSLEPLPVSRSCASLYSSSEATQLYGSSASAAAYRLGHSGRMEEPQQPSLAMALASIMTTVEKLEEKLCNRLDSLESRLSSQEMRITSMEKRCVECQCSKNDPSVQSA